MNDEYRKEFNRVLDVQIDGIKQSRPHGLLIYGSCCGKLEHLWDELPPMQMKPFNHAIHNRFARRKPGTDDTEYIDTETEPHGQVFRCVGYYMGQTVCCIVYGHTKVDAEESCKDACSMFWENSR